MKRLEEILVAGEIKQWPKDAADQGMPPYSAPDLRDSHVAFHHYEAIIGRNGEQLTLYDGRVLYRAWRIVDTDKPEHSPIAGRRRPQYDLF